MAFDAEKATWIDPAGACPDFGGNCKGQLGIDPNNRKEIACSMFGCPAKLPKIVISSVVEAPTH